MCIRDRDEADSVLDNLSYAELLSGDRPHESHVYHASSDNVKQPFIDEYDILYGVSDDYMDYHAYATTKWHRVIHEKIDPVRLQPYLGGRPLRVIKKTLSRTTQMAHMIIRHPLHRHLKSRLPHMNVTRLDEAVSTDPMFANCCSLYHNFTGA